MHPFPEQNRPSPRRLRAAGILGLLVALALALGGVALRMHAGSTLKAKTEAQAIPTVSVIDPVPGDSREQLVLPGNVQAYFDAPIYARVSGYLKKWYFDI